MEDTAAGDRPVIEATPWLIGHKSDVPPRTRIFFHDPVYEPKRGPSIVLWTNPEKNDVTVFRGGKGITKTLAEAQKRNLLEVAYKVLAAYALGADINGVMFELDL
jgi:hypothetical protein